MTDTQTICVSVVIIVGYIYAGWYRLVSVLNKAVDKFELDEVEVVGRSVKVKGKSDESITAQ